MKDTDAMVAALEAARVIATGTILHAFQRNRDIMLKVGDDFAEGVTSTLKEVHELAFDTRH